MTDWTEFDNSTLDEIDREIREIKAMPFGKRTPKLADRLSRLRDARYRVTGYRCDP